MDCNLEKLGFQTFPGELILFVLEKYIKKPACRRLLFSCFTAIYNGDYPFFTHEVSLYIFAHFLCQIPTETFCLIPFRRYVLSQGADDHEKEELSALVSCSRPEMDIIQNVLSVVLR